MAYTVGIESMHPAFESKVITLERDNLTGFSENNAELIVYTGFKLLLKNIRMFFLKSNALCRIIGLVHIFLLVLLIKSIFNTY